MPLQKKKDKYENSAKQKTDWSPNTVRATTEQLEGFRNAQKPRKKALVDEYQNRKRVDEYNKKQERDKKSSIMQGIRMSYEKEMRKQGVLVNADPAIDKMTQQRFGTSLDSVDNVFNPQPQPLKDYSIEKPENTLTNDDVSVMDKAISAITNAFAGRREVGFNNFRLPGDTHLGGANNGISALNNTFNTGIQLSLRNGAQEDTFAGQSKAHLTSGYLSQRANEAWNDYMNDPTDEKRQIAENYTRQLNQYASANEAALDDMNQKAGLLSNDLASYVPQLADQIKYEARPALLGGLLGGQTGYNIGQMAGSAGYSYQSMRGAAFQDLISQGVDEATAASAATNEALISTVVELGDNVLDIFLGAIPGAKFVKGGVDSLKDKVTSLAWSKFGKIATKLGIEGMSWIANIGSEGLEEYLQECVSIANEKAVTNGRTQNVLQLAGDAIGIAMDGLKDLYKQTVHGEQAGEDSQRLYEAFGGGARLSLILHPAGRASNVATEVIRNNNTGRQVNASAKASDLFAVAQEAVDNARVMEETATTQLDRLKAEDSKAQAENFMGKVVTAAEDGKKLSNYEVGKQVNQNAENHQNVVMPYVAKEIIKSNEAEDAIQFAVADAADNGGTTTDEVVLSLLENDKAREYISSATGKDFNALELKDAMSAVQDYLQDATKEYNEYRVAEKADAMGENGAKVLSANYKNSGIESANEYNKAFDAYYSYGAQLGPETNVVSNEIFDKAIESVGVDLDRDIAQRAVIAGFNDVKNGTIELGGANGKENSGSGSGRIYHLADGRQTESASGERGKIASGYASGRQRAARVKDVAAAQIGSRNGQKVSSLDLGIKHGTSSKRNVVLDAESIEALGYTEKVRELERRTGAKVVLVTGVMEGEVVTADGVQKVTYRGMYDSDTNTLICQADNRNLEFDVLGLHEEFHSKFKDCSEAERARYMNEIKAKIAGHDEASFLNLFRAYNDKYGWKDMGYTDEYIMEEIYADAYAGIDIWSYLSTDLGAARYTEAVRNSIDEILGKVEKHEAIDIEDQHRFSRELDDELFEKAKEENKENKYVAAAVMRQAGLDRAEIKKILDKIPKNLLPEEKGNLSGVNRDEYGNKKFTVYGNSSYSKSVENTSVCIRSLAMERLFDQAAKKFGHSLTTDEAITLSQMAWELTDEPTCQYCYVFADRVAERNARNQYIEQRNDAVEKLKKASIPRVPTADELNYSVKGKSGKFSLKDAVKAHPELEDVYKVYNDFGAGRKNTPNMQERFIRFVDSVKNGTELVSAADVTTDEAMLEAEKKGGAIADEIADIRRYASNASHAKAKVAYTAYNNDILNFSADLVIELNKEYGLRFYSYSDYHPAFLLENMQMYTDAAVKGLKGLAYTKDIDYARIFEPTGANINISTKTMDKPVRWDSLTAEQQEEYSYMTPVNGMVYMPDEMQGANLKESIALRQRSIENGTGISVIMVCTSDAQVEWAMKQEWCDVIIPYHVVFSQAIKDTFLWKNYKAWQEDKKIRGKWHEGNAKHITPIMHGNDLNTYLQALEENNLSPRFEQWLKKDPANYMKLVNETRRSYRDTQALQPIFNMEEARKVGEKLENGKGYDWFGHYLSENEDVAEEYAERYNNGERYNASVGGFTDKETAKLDHDYAVAIDTLNSDTATRAAKNKAQKYLDGVKTQYGFSEAVEYDSNGNPVALSKRIQQDGVQRFSVEIEYADGTKESYTNPSEVTDEEAIHYLTLVKKRKLKDYTYFPVMGNTPSVILDSIKEYGLKAENLPLVMQADKAWQAMDERNRGASKKKYGSNIRGHALSPQMVLNVIKALEHPTDIVYQTNRFNSKGEQLENNFAIFVDLGNDEGVAIVELDAKFSDGVIGENGEQKFNTVVTTFIPDTERDGIEFDYAEHLLNNPNNDRVTIVEKATHEDLHRLDSRTDLDESLNDSISDSSSKVKHSTDDSDGTALTSQQQEYFRDSKIRDENGNLIVMYHGSESTFTTFENRPARNGRKYGDGFYFTEDKKAARSWGKGKVYKTYLNITNPLTVSANEAVPEALDNALRLQYSDHYDELSANPKWFGNEYTKEEYIENEMKYITNSQEAFFALEGGNDVLKDLGYDGIIVPAESWMPEKHYAEVVAFDASQIKNSTNKKPTSGTDIRYSTESDDGFYSKLEQEIELYKGDKIGASSVVSYLKGKGVKDEEIKWTGIVPFLEGRKSVSKSELLDYVRANQLRIEEVGIDGISDSIYDSDMDAHIPYDQFLESAKMYADHNDYTYEVKKTDKYVTIVFKDEDGHIADYREYKFEARTKWDAYKTDGGTNYREILFKMPGSTYSNQAMHVHWDQRGVLAHARIQDFATSSGKTLFVEEIQSDWHNAGQKNGYSNVDTENLQEQYDGLSEYSKLHYGMSAGRLIMWAGNEEWLMEKFPGRVDEVEDFVNEVESIREQIKENKGKAPDAPFKNGKYVEYVMKRLLRMAAEGGYDSIAWTTGSMQEERWSDDFAEGYRIEYDQDIPKFMNKYGKQWGAKVEDRSLFGYDYSDFYKAKATAGKIAGNASEATGVDFDAAYEYIVDNHHSILSRNESGKVDLYLLKSKQYEQVAEYWNMLGKVGTTVHMMDLTDSMKKSVLTKGQARFSQEDVGYHAGDLGKAESYAQQGYYRGTGHFGTGTYFVGNESEIRGYNNRNGKEAPHEKVDFSKYNLFRPGERRGLQLHESLKVLDGGINEKYLDAAIRGDFRHKDALSHFDLYEKYRDMDLDPDEADIRAYQEELESIDPEEIDYEFKTYDDFFKDYSKNWDDVTEDEYEFYKDEYSDYLKRIVKEYNERENDLYGRLRDAVFNLQLMFGFDETEKALRETLKYQEDIRNAPYDKQRVSDSLATAFMKALGYEGIDVRGTNLDNTAYGSVIYDLKGKDLDRKNEIGTARYSQESDDFAERTIREENDYLKGAYASLLTEVRTNKGSAAKMRTNANKVSDGIREAYESRIDKNDLRARINRLVQNYIIGGEQNEAMAYDNAKNEAVNIARDIINNAGRLKNADEYDRYLDLKKRLKNNDGIYLDPSLRGDPEKYQEIRKRLFGTMNIKNSGTALDTFYSGLVNDFGELFSAEAAPGIDQLQAIEEVLNTLAPIYENPYNGKIAEAIEICANDILMSLNNGSIIPDSQAQNARQQAKMEKVRQDSIDYARRAIAAERVHEQKRIDRALDYYKNRDLRKADNAEREKLRRIANRLNNRKLPAVTRALVEQYIGDLDLISVRLTNKRLENLKDLRLWYEDQQTNNPDFVKDPEIEKLLQRLSTRQISELNIEEVRWLTTCLQNIENELAIAKKTIDTEDQRDIHIQADESMNDIDHSKGNGNNAFTQGIDSFFVNGTLSPIRAVKRMVGYNTESPIFKRTVELEQGQIKSFDWQRKAEANFLRWTNDKKFMRSITGKNAELIDIGNGAKITPAMRMSLYLHSKNEQNMRHIIYGGITVPDMKRYKDGNMAKAYGKGAQTIKLNAKQVREIVAGMTEQEKAFADAAADYFNGMSQESINEVSEKLKGYSLALVQNYFPINTNSNFTLADYETVKMDGTIEGMGFLKERQNASNPIYLRDITDVLNKSISSTAKYVGLAIPVRNFNKIYNVSSSEFGDEAKAALEEMKNAKSLKERYAARDRMREARELFTGSMRESVMQNWDVEGIEYIENMMADIQNPRGSRSAWAKLFQNVRGNYAGSVLGLSASVAMKQAASYPTAAAVLGWKPLNQAFLDVHKIGKKFDMNLVNRYTPLLWHRASNFNVQYLGNVGTAVNQNKIQELLSSKALNWITDMDVATTRLLWFASEHYVQNENKALVKGSDAYYREVAEIYNRVITETQPNYTTMERPQLLRTDDTLLSSMMMFKTQSFQNFNVLYDAIGNRLAKGAALKVIDSEENRTALESAKKDLKRAALSQLVQTFVFAAMTAVCAAILGRNDKYKDDDDEVTMLSLAKQVGKDMLSGAMSMVPFGGELYNVLARVLWNEKYYGFDNITASSLDDMFNAFIKAADSVKNGASALLKIKDADGNVPEWNWNEQRINLDSVLNAVTKVYGIPYDNASKILEAAVQHVAKGTMGEYEGTYTYLRLTKKMSDTGAYYDNLFKAYENDRKSYDDLKKKMIADGFDEEKMRNAVNNRLKKAAGVASVSDLDHKLVDPAYQSEYDTAIDMLLKSPEYKKLDSGEQDKRRSAVETTLKDPDKVSKLDKAGLDVTTYSLYTTARKLADVQGDNNGSYNKDEKEAAIKMLLNSKEITSAEASKLRKYDK